MMESNWSRRYVSLVGLLVFCAWGLPVFAGEMKSVFNGTIQSLASPLVHPNSTFHSDSRLPQTSQRLRWQQDIEPQKQLRKTLNAHWFKTHLALPQDTPITSAGTNSAQAPVTSSPPASQPGDDTGIRWKPLIAQSMTFLWIEHSFRLLTEPGTRDELRGPFFKDWFTSVRNTRNWEDGDPIIVNYVGHSMQGAITGYIYVHNDPKSLKLEMGMNKAYFKSRMKAMLFSTVYSTQFELGPLSEASIGNVGRIPSEKSLHPSAFVDLVITPTLGTAWMMAEEALDRYVIKRLEDHVENRVVRLLVRGFLNPSKSFANALRGKYPWNRDGRRL